jgi:hypothetical protein
MPKSKIPTQDDQRTCCVRFLCTNTELCTLKNDEFVIWFHESGSATVAGALFGTKLGTKAFCLCELQACFVVCVTAEVWGDRHDRL